MGEPLESTLATFPIFQATRIVAKSNSAQQRYWLFKTEPDCFSIQDLAKKKDQTTFWDGVRNYQARNFLRDDIHLGDRVLVYHSSTEPMAIVGVAKVVKPGYPDQTALDPKSDHFDPKSSRENPIWFMVDIQLERIFAEPLTLAQLRATPALAGMELLRKGSRLSIQPVRAQEYETVLKLADSAGPKPAGKSTAKTAASQRAARSAR